MKMKHLVTLIISASCSLSIFTHSCFADRYPKNFAIYNHLGVPLVISGRDFDCVSEADPAVNGPHKTIPRDDDSKYIKATFLKQVGACLAGGAWMAWNYSYYTPSGSTKEGVITCTMNTCHNNPAGAKVTYHDAYPVSLTFEPQ